MVARSLSSRDMRFSAVKFPCDSGEGRVGRGAGEGFEEEEEEAEEHDAIESKPLTNAIDINAAKMKSDKKIREGAGTGKLEGRLIVAEKRTTGSVSWKSEILVFICLSMRIDILGQQYMENI